MRESMRQTKRVEQFGGVLLRLSALAWPTHAGVDHVGQQRVLQHGKFWKQVIKLKHKSHAFISIGVARGKLQVGYWIAIKPHAAGIRVALVQQAKQVQKRAFSTARRAKYGNPLALGQGKTGSAKHGHFHASKRVGLA